MKANIDIEELEREIAQTPAPAMDDDEYNDELNRLQGNLDIPFTDISKKMKLFEADDEIADDSPPSSSSGITFEFADMPGMDQMPSNPPVQHQQEHFSPRPAPSVSFNTNANTVRQQGDFGALRPGSDLHQRTMEEQKQQTINSVLDSMSANNSIAHNLEQYKQDDMKSILIERIGSMRQLLAEEDIDISNIPEVTFNTPYDTVEQIDKMLNRKIMRSRYSSMFEEAFSLFSYGVEAIFDGKREMFGYKPNMKGYHNTAAMKLRRLRYQTSTIVNNTLAEWGIGPGTQILLELIPSAILYGKQNSESYGEQGLCSNDAARRAQCDIRDFDDRND